ncbi:DNA helicase RecQ [Heyndrickxia acidicola]|uniref:DNA helicase RecQ n=1 Tax=Heyndrickxia acidicola TaxID=209389 RepID=A0ABU6MEM3_9BACI|nr:DNA helicase RecQ [Heyndrickxia acidicola]MED1202852.1 DNA helicase RecQ [Heyndrickxia acidicola]
MNQKAKEILRTYFGYTDFRPGQEKLIHNILSGRDSLGIMPTGGGKSICYQVPSLMLPGVTLVVSPLISLMKDQVDALVSAGVSAAFINSSLSNDEIRETISGAASGKYKLLYIAPERFESAAFMQLIKEIEVSLIAIDEAHCISQWGHDFRPSYLLIKQLIQQIQPKPVIAALTATATPNVKEDILHLLDISHENVILTGFARENLHFNVVKGQDRDRFLFDYIKQNSSQAGIIYAATRKEVDRLHEQLVNSGVRAGKYHAGMSENQRKDFQEQFLFDNISVMVATSAFGMGINKSNVRYVLHYHIPRNMEAYYQEAGRAGRDGVESECILLFSPQDVHIQKFLLDQSIMEEERKESEYGKLRKMVSYCHTETCFQQFILQYFGEEDAAPCGKCGNCTDKREQVDVTREAQMVFSCIKRMNERFGKTFITKVLSGSNDQKIKSMGFNSLSTYGIMRDKTQKYINEFIDFLTADGYLVPSDGQFPVLSLTNKAFKVLLSEESVMRKEMVRAAQLVEDHELFESLRALRKELAENEKIPPYIIFSDQTLREICSLLPSSYSEFLKVKGVGEKKLEQYGQIFLEAIQSYKQQHGIEGNAAVIEQMTVSAAQKSKQSDSKEKSHHTTYQLLIQGLPLEEIALNRNMSIRTIEAHLIKCAEEGMPIQWEEFIPEEYEKLIAAAYKEANTDRLTPIKELLPEEVTFFMIRAFIQKEKLQPN